MDSKFYTCPDDITPDRVQRIAQRLHELGLYDTSAEGSVITASPIFESENLFQWRQVIDAASSATEVQHFIDDMYPWAADFLDHATLATVLPKYQDLIAKTTNPFQNELSLTNFIVGIKNLVGLPGKDQLPKYFAEATEAFYEACPDGKIILIHKSQKLPTLLRIPPILATTHYLSNDEITAQFEPKKSKGEKSFRMFEASHFLMNRNFYAWLLTLSTQSVGFTINHLSCEVIFLFGKGVSFKVPRLQGEIFSLNSPMWGDPAPTSHLSIGTGSYLELLEWYTKHLSELLKNLVDITKFTTESGEMRPNTQYEALLTVDSLLEIYTRLMITYDPLVKKLLFFDFLDRYMALTGKSESSQVFSSKQYEKYLSAIDASVPGSLKTHATTAFREFRNRAIRETLDGINPNTRRQSGMVVISRDGKEVVDEETYVWNLLDGIRDTVHSYSLNKDKFQKFLSIHNGHISGYFAELCSTLMFHMFISSATGFERYKHLPDV